MSLCKRIYFQDLPSFMAQNMVPGDFQTELESKLLLVEIPIRLSRNPKKDSKAKSEEKSDSMSVLSFVPSFVPAINPNNRLRFMN